jgi:hypothetical protein
VPRRSRRSDALERALDEADARVEHSTPDEIRQLGNSQDARQRLLALALARRRIERAESPQTYFDFDTLGGSWIGDRDDPNFKKLESFVRNARRGRSNEG